MAATEPKGHGQHAGLWVFPDVSVMSREVTEKTKSSPRPLTMALVVTGILFILGIVGFVARAADDGFNDISAWGYYLSVFSMVFMVTSGAPLAAVAFRFTKSHWRRPLSRVSELFAIAGILNILLFIPLMLLLPPIGNPDAVGGLIEGELAVRRTIWFEAPIGSPHAWDLVGVAGLVVTALFILWLSEMPDMAESRHTATGFRRTLYSKLSGNWYGTKKQWNAQKAGLASVSYTHLTLPTILLV